NPFAESTLYSNYGSTIDIAAPGGETDFGTDHGILSTLWDFVVGAPTFGFWDGTSMAAPHVSGVAALLAAQEPGLTAGQLRSRLETWAVDVGSPGWDPFTGVGVVNARNALRQTLGPSRSIWVRAVNSQTGQIRPAVAAPGGNFSLTVPEGEWVVLAGQDVDGDGEIGIPGRRWGTLGATGRPTPVAVGPGATVSADFTLGWPVEEEPNEVIADATYLPLNGYTTGQIAPGQTDLFRFDLARPSSVVVQTNGYWGGACGYARSANTNLTLMNANQVAVAANDDVEPARYNLCSRIAGSLAAGTYYVRVEGGPMAFGSNGAKIYEISLRTAP
ncbi:MAG: S8 family serine peptidase, partial [Gemmatimonadales bacterium]